MAAADQPAVEPAVVASWRERVVVLRRQLDTHPDHDWAWLWRLRLDVTEHLLRRYAAGGPTREQLLVMLTAPAADPTQILSPEPYASRPMLNSASLLAEDAASTGHSGRLQAALRQIAASNVEPRAELQEKIRDSHLRQRRRWRRGMPRWLAIRILSVERLRRREGHERRRHWLLMAAKKRGAAAVKARPTVIKPAGTPMSQVSLEQMVLIASPTLNEDEILAILEGRADQSSPSAEPTNFESGNDAAPD